MRAAVTGAVTKRYVPGTAIAGAAILAFVVLACFPGAWVASKALGHGPNETLRAAINIHERMPVGVWTRAADGHGGSTLLILGGDAVGRDELLRLLYGGRRTVGFAIVTMTVAGVLGIILARMMRRMRLPRPRALAAAFVTAALAYVLIRAIVYGAFQLHFFREQYRHVFWEFSAWFGLVLAPFVAMCVSAGVRKATLLCSVAAALVIVETEAEYVHSVWGLAAPASWGKLTSDAWQNYWNSWLPLWPALAAAITAGGFILLGVGLGEVGRRAHPRGSLT